MCFTALVDTIRVRRAERDDAFIVGALVLAMDLESHAPNREGFIAEYADAWLSDYDHRPTWLACEPDGTAVGLLQATLVRRLPSLRRPVGCWVHVARVFVRPDHRGRGTAGRLLDRLLAWGAEHQVVRYQLSFVPAARGLYQRAGFTRPDRLMERREEPGGCDRQPPTG